jgi:hypothetical protein
LKIISGAMILHFVSRYCLKLTNKIIIRLTYFNHCRFVLIWFAAIGVNATNWINHRGLTPIVCAWSPWATLGRWPALSGHPCSFDTYQDFKSEPFTAHSSLWSLPLLSELERLRGFNIAQQEARKGRSNTGQEVRNGRPRWPLVWPPVPVWQKLATPWCNFRNVWDEHLSIHQIPELRVDTFQGTTNCIIINSFLKGSESGIVKSKFLI